MNIKNKKPLINPEYKKWIDNANYYELLKRWRFSDMDNIFQGKTGEYYTQIMADKKKKLSHNAQVKTSKLIGWDR